MWMGANRTERIMVFEGDESEELAERVVQEHGFYLNILERIKIFFIEGLDSNMKFNLKDLLYRQIAVVLTRIEEERASLNYRFRSSIIIRLNNNENIIG